MKNGNFMLILENAAVAAIEKPQEVWTRKKTDFMFYPGLDYL